MRKLITESPSLLADVMRPQPVFANGKQTGYRVYPGRNRQAFTRLGLRPGDLVTAVNGTPLDDPEHGQQIFNTLGASSEAHVTVQRNGQQQDVVLNLAQVTQEAESLSGAPSSGSAAPGDQAQPASQPPGAPGPADQPKTPDNMQQ
jgi:general secretion pathway protein C